MRSLRAMSLLTASSCVLLFTACSSTDQSIAPVNRGADRASSYSSATSQEQLFVLLDHYSTEQSSLLRYSIGSAAPSGTTALPNGQKQLAVSSGDQYVITSDGSTGANVYGPNGSHTMIADTPSGSEFGPTMAMSTNEGVLALITYDANAGTAKIKEYRAPFTQSFQTTTGQDPQPSGGLSLLNEDGSQAIGIEGGGLGARAQIIVIPSGRSSSISTRDGAVPSSQFQAYDGPRGWLYAWGSTNASGPLNRIEIFDTVNGTYLGYINIPAAQKFGGMAVHQQTGDLYVVLNDKINVYDIPHCGCTIPLHSFNAALPAQSNGYLQLAVDTQNAHLFLYASGYQVPAPYNQEIVDQNPATGTVQGTYHLTSADARIAGVVAQ